MEEDQIKSLLSSADCAERTGLSLKALRIYERYGLISPKRSANGWRGYDRADLERLNSISVLKAIGLTLRQIRTLLIGSNPPLKRVLEIQIETCAKRRLDAERAEMMATTALQRIEEHHELTIEELCSLVKGVVANSVPPQIQRLLDKHMTANEQAAWRQGTARTPQGMADVKAYARAQQEEIFVPLRALMNAGAQPESPEVQALLDHDNQLMTLYAVRERLVRIYESNPVHFGNALNVGRDLMRGRKEDPAELSEGLPDADVVSFFFRAGKMSALEHSLESLMTELRQVGQPENVVSDDVQLIAEKFCEMCRQYYLGNPLIYARWAQSRHAGLHERADTESVTAWACLARVLEQMPLLSQQTTNNQEA